MNELGGEVYEEKGGGPMQSGQSLPRGPNGFSDAELKTEQARYAVRNKWQLIEITKGKGRMWRKQYKIILTT